MKKNILKKILSGVALTFMLGIGISTVSNFMNNGNVASAASVYGTKPVYEKIAYSEELAKKQNIKDRAQWDRIQNSEIEVAYGIRDAKGQKAINNIEHKYTDYLLKEGIITEEQAKLEHIYIDAEDIEAQTIAYNNLINYLNSNGK